MNILLIGDSRTAKNFGSIATTEALLELILKKAEKENMNVDIKTIDQRSFEKVTPVDGWEISAEKYLHNTIESNSKVAVSKILQFFNLIDIAVKIKHKFESKKEETDVPSIFPEYNIYAQYVMKGCLFNYEARLINWADIVVINGEGYIVSGTDSSGKYRIKGRYILFISYISKRIFNKPCYIINHTVDPKNRDIREIIENIYPMFDGVYVREGMSKKVLDEWGIDNIKRVPDALFSYDFEKDPKCKKPNKLRKFDFSKPYICLGDSSGIANMYDEVKWNWELVYKELIEKLRTIYPQIIFINGLGGSRINKIIEKSCIPFISVSDTSYQELYYVLKRAKLFVSGRWHTSIISLLAKTPILLWGADSHKTEALYKEINYPYRFFDIKSIPINIDRLVDEARKIVYDNHDEIWKNVECLKNLSINNVDWMNKFK